MRRHAENAPISSSSLPEDTAYTHLLQLYSARQPGSRVWSGGVECGWGELAGKIAREVLQTDPWTPNKKFQGINEWSEYPQIVPI